MSTFKERSKIRKKNIKTQNKADQKEKQRLKALPKPLRKLEKELGDYVDFMEVYDGYLGDFTGEVIPVDLVKNPFAVIHGMGLNFPHPHSLNDVQKAEYVHNIEKAFERLGFFFDCTTPFANETQLEYEQLYYFIENPPEAVFENRTGLKTDQFSINIERLDRDY